MNESPQAPAIVEALLKAKAKIEATCRVRNQEGDAVLRFTSRGGAVCWRRWVFGDDSGMRWVGVGVGTGETLAMRVCVDG